MTLLDRNIDFELEKSHFHFTRETQLLIFLNTVCHFKLEKKSMKIAIFMFTFKFSLAVSSTYMTKAFIIVI